MSESKTVRFGSRPHAHYKYRMYPYLPLAPMYVIAHNQHVPGGGLVLVPAVLFSVFFPSLELSSFFFRAGVNRRDNRRKERERQHYRLSTCVTRPPGRATTMLRLASS